MIDQTVSEQEQNNEQVMTGIHPLTQELKDMPVLSKEIALEEVQSAPINPPRDPNIGTMLKRVRESKGHSLKLVSQQTKIHLALLEALEDNQLIRLPSKTYVKGFIKSYAKILNIPQTEAIDLFEKTYREYEGLPPIQNPIQQETVAQVQTQKDKSFNTPEAISEIANIASHNGNLILKAGLAILVIAIVGFNIKSMIERSVGEEPQQLPEVISTTSKPKKVEAAQPKEQLPASELAAEATPTVAPTINLITKETLKPDIKIDDELTLKAFSQVEKQQKEITMAKEEFDEFLPPKFRVTVENGSEYVFINATAGDSWLTYKTDNNDIKKFVLRQGRTLFLRGKEIRLFVGNTKNLKVFHNNKPIELITSSGVKNAVFPEALKSKYMNPLFVFQKDGTVITSDDAVEKVKSESSTKKLVPATTNSTTPIR